MKKKILLWPIMMICLIAAGCQREESVSPALVEEIPIETQADSHQEEAVSASDVQEEMAGAVKTEPYEEIEVEVNGDKGSIIVGTTGAPFTEILTQAKIQLAKDGWDLQIKRYDDYEKLNEDVLNNTLDAHLFAHQTYIDSYNDVNKTNLVSASPICYEVYGIYSVLNEDLTKISGAIVGIPQDASQKARALLFMNDLGWITLKENVGMTAIMEDIEENTKNLQFAEYTQDTLSKVMSESDYCVIGADMAIVEGLDTEEEVIRTETKNNTSALIYASLLVTTQEKASDTKIQVLADALTSNELEEYAKETYKGALDFIK